MAPKKVKLPLPKNDAEVNEYITALAEAQNAAKKAVLKANEKMTVIQAALAEELDRQEAIVEQHAAALFTYFERNRDELTDGGRRQSRTFATGVLGNRWTPPRTQIKDEKLVEQFVVKHQMKNFYEEKIVLRRDVMLANPELAKTIPGVSIVRDRIIYVTPDTFDEEIPLKKKIELAA